MIMIDFNNFLSQVLNGYRTNYDVETFDDDSTELVATATMHVKHTQTFILKEFEMSSASADEYVYVFKTDHLTVEKAKEFIDRAYDLGYPQIDLEHTTFKKQHMCTRLVALVFCDSADEEALKIIKKCRIYKSFQFSLKGWMEMHTVTVDLSDGKVISNHYGRETAKYLKKHVDHYMKNVK